MYGHSERLSPEPSTPGAFCPHSHPTADAIRAGDVVRARELVSRYLTAGDDVLDVVVDRLAPMVADPVDGTPWTS